MPEPLRGSAFPFVRWRCNPAKQAGTKAGKQRDHLGKDLEMPEDQASKGRGQAGRPWPGVCGHGQGWGCMGEGPGQRALVGEGVAGPAQNLTTLRQATGLIIPRTTAGREAMRGDTGRPATGTSIAFSPLLPWVRPQTLLPQLVQPSPKQPASLQGPHGVS